MIDSQYLERERYRDLRDAGVSDGRAEYLAKRGFDLRSAAEEEFRKMPKRKMSAGDIGIVEPFPPTESA